MKADTSTHSNTHRSHTLDLFASPVGGDSPAVDSPPTGDGAVGLPERPPEPRRETPGGEEALTTASPEKERTDAAWPALADVCLHRTEPFRVPGLKGLVLPVPVFRVKLVRERDHLTRQVTTPADAARLCSELLDGYDREVFLVIALSTANRVIGAHVAHVGTVDASIASPREVFKFCLGVNARSFLVAHNHPSGNLEPSKADVAVSKQLAAAGEAIGIRLLDSLVCGFDGAYTSLAERGLIGGGSAR